MAKTVRELCAEAWLQATVLPGEVNLVRRFLAETQLAAANPGAVVQIDPVQSEFGWHIIRVLGHENRPLTAVECQYEEQTKFQDWLTEYRNAAQVEILDYWQEIVPLQPTLAPEVLQAVQQASGAPEGLPTTP